MKLNEYTIYAESPYLQILEDDKGKYFTVQATATRTCTYDEYDFATHGALAKILHELSEIFSGGYLVFKLPKNNLDVKFAAFKKTWVEKS